MLNNVGCNEAVRSALSINVLCIEHLVLFVFCNDFHSFWNDIVNTFSADILLLQLNIRHSCYKLNIIV